MCTWVFKEYFSGLYCGTNEGRTLCTDASFRASKLGPHIDTASTIQCRQQSSDRNNLGEFIDTPLEIRCIEGERPLPGSEPEETNENTSVDPGASTESGTIASQRAFAVILCLAVLAMHP